MVHCVTWYAQSNEVDLGMEEEALFKMLDADGDGNVTVCIYVVVLACYPPAVAICCSLMAVW